MPRGRPPGKRVNQTPVLFTPDQLRRLDVIAEQRGASRAQVVRDAVDAYTARFFLPTLATDSQFAQPVAEQAA